MGREGRWRRGGRHGGAGATRRAGHTAAVYGLAAHRPVRALVCHHCNIIYSSKLKYFDYNLTFLT